jgi:hypothetical protein
MKNVILLLLFVIGLASCTIEKRKYFKGYHIALRQAQGPGKWENGEMGKWENGEMGEWGNGKMGKWENDQEKQFADSEPQQDHRSDIIIEGYNTAANEVSTAGDSIKVSEAQKPQQGGMRITPPHDVITAAVPSPITNTTQIFKHHKSQALKGAGKLFLLGLITLVLLITLVIFLISNGTVTAILISLIVGLALAIGIYLLLLFIFFALLMFIIKTFGS